MQPDEIQQRLDDGWLVLTPNQQWVRELHAELMQRTGVLPSAMSVAAWVERLWQQLALAGTEPCASKGIVSAQQEQALWHQVLQQDTTLQAQGRAAMAPLVLDAIDRSLLYQMPLQPRDDFPVMGRLMQWWAEFQQLCAQTHLVSRAEAMQLLTECADTDAAPHWPGILLYGFAPPGGEEMTPEPTPLLQELLSRFADESTMHSFETDAHPPVSLHCADNLEQELAAAASWARRNPGKTMQIIVPNLAGNLHRVRRLLTEYLGEAQSADTDKARWALRLGTAVADTPVLQHFLDWLELTIQPLPAERVLKLLRSGLPATDQPLASPQHIEDCVRLELKLRRRLQLHFDAAQLQKQLEQVELASESAQKWQQQLIDLVQRLRHLPDKATLAEWARRLYEELHAMGGLDRMRVDEPLQRALTELLEQLEALDVVLPSAQLDLREAMFWLRWLASSARLPAGDKDAEVWVGSGLDARPLPVDSTWVLGFDADTWPRVTGGNPLLPLGEQKKRAMPGADPQHSYEFSQHLLRRLLSRSGEVVLTLSPHSGSETPEYSPLLQVDGDTATLNLGSRQGELACEIKKLDKSDLQHSPSQLKLGEIRDADKGLPRWDEQERLQTAYINTLQLQLSDPLAAFAAARLGASPLDRPEQGINARTLGIALHDVLEKLLPAGTELNDEIYGRLAEGSELDEILAQVMRDEPKQLRHISVQEMRRCVLAWLQVERHFPWLAERKYPWRVGRVQATEQALEGRDDLGIPWRVRIDRVDRAVDGSIRLLDYKSGKAGSDNMVTRDGRLREQSVQLLAYAQAWQQVEGELPPTLFYAWLDLAGGKPGFKGVDSNDEAVSPLLMKLQQVRQDFVDAVLGDGSSKSSNRRDEYQLLRPQTGEIEEEETEQ